MFDFNTYIDLISNRNFDEARKFKDNNIPKALFKFISLTQPTNCVTTCKYDTLSQQKIDTIRKNQIWLSTFDNLNDPFELKSFYINEEKIKEHGYPIEYINQLIDSYKNFLIASFTTRFLDNLPMWAHYSNNHQGICLEYEINKPNLFFPISYEKKRLPANVILMNCLSLICKEIEGNISEKEKNDLELYQTILFHSALIKDSSWEYEDEYRLLHPILISKIKEIGGMAVTTKSEGIKLKNIYLGMNCNKFYRQQLIDIASELNIGIFDIFFNSETSKYKLDKREIK